MPLALEQAAAYIVTTQAPFAVYLASYRQRRLDLLNESAPMMGGDREPVATTWNLNFAAVAQASPAAADLLRASAFLHPDSIPYDLMVSGAELLGEAIQGALANAEADPLAFLALLAPLRQYSLVQSEPDQTYRVHSLVQAAVRANLPEPDERRWAERVVEMVTQAYPNADDFNHWPECDRLLLHAQNTAAVIQELSLESETVALLKTRLGFYLKAQGRYEAAEPLYQEALTTRKVLLGDAHPDVAISLNNLAALYKAQGRYEAAEPLYQEALAMRKVMLGDTHLDVATSLNNLAELYRSQGRYEAAEPLYQESLAMRKALLGETHPNVANSLNNLALMYTSQGRYETAEPLYQEALTIRKALLGEAHPNVANSLNNLALMYTSQGRYKAAEPLYQEALAMRKALLGEAHPDVAQSLNNLAVLYRSQGRYAEAEPLAIQSLQMSTNFLDSNHPDVAICLGNLATLRVAQGDFDEVEAMFLQAHQIFVNAVGSKHPYTCKTIKRLAQFVSTLIEAGQTDRLTDHPLTQFLLQQFQQS